MRLRTSKPMVAIPRKGNLVRLASRARKGASLSSEAVNRVAASHGDDGLRRAAAHAVSLPRPRGLRGVACVNKGVPGRISSDHEPPFLMSAIVQGQHLMF